VIQARFVDEVRAQALSRIGIQTIGDLLAHVPFRYMDLSRIATLADAPIGLDATVVGTVHEVRVKTPRPRLTVTEVSVVDGTGVLIAVWFNQPWVAQRHVVGERVALAGKVEFDYGFKRMKAPLVERLPPDDDPVTAGRVLPVHRATEGLSTAWLRRLIAGAVDDFADVPDHLPVEIRIRRGLPNLAAALRSVHFPVRLPDAEAARRRLAYDELLVLLLYMAMRRHSLTREQAGVPHVIDGARLGRLRDALPFELTADQAAAVSDILQDMGKPRPMNRMLLGDVGTGKTVVATCALVAAADSGMQATMMAPTEVLATQYAERVGPLLDGVGVTWSLLTGSTSPSSRRDILARAADASLDVLFGTHALLEESVTFSRLSLAIVDEQHRFGVTQRRDLRGKGAAVDLLVMSATPIPRSLALTLYGDLATSYVRSRPSSASGVTTHHVKPHAARPAHEAVRAAVRDGRQAFVVCALVDESKVSAAKAAVREAERLKNEVFPDLRVGLLTGRMKSSEKAEVMAAFRRGDIDVLVSTTVIEVGIDVPNATVMLIEDADRFGMAQLHQLRGRVGRGSCPGEVWLIADPKSQESRARIQALIETTDGFELADRDLRLRGEGQVMGDRQHGVPDLRVASLIDDLELVRAAREDAFRIISDDPHLRADHHAPLLRRVKRVFSEGWQWVSSG
jgi:ATP-dependent DNA helicase RecG